MLQQQKNQWKKKILNHTISVIEAVTNYRVAKTRRMPGRAASGGALAPEPAARRVHSCRSFFANEPLIRGVDRTYEGVVRHKLLDLPN